MVFSRLSQWDSLDTVVLVSCPVAVPEAPLEGHFLGFRSHPPYRLEAGYSTSLVELLIPGVIPRRQLSHGEVTSHSAGSNLIEK